MNLTDQLKEGALEGVTVKVADEPLENLRRPVTPITPLEDEPIKAMKLRASPRKVWWPASCRGIVG